LHKKSLQLLKTKAQYGDTMERITQNHVKGLLFFLQNPLTDVYPQLLATELGISRVGALKLLRSLADDKFIRVKKVGSANTYRLHPKKEHVRALLAYAIQEQIRMSPNRVKMWVNRITEIKSASCAILFGSIIHKEKPNDIDVVFVAQQKKFAKLREEIHKINVISKVKIHHIFQTKEDLISNIRKKDPAILKALQGVIVQGAEEYFDVLLEVLGEQRELH